VSFNHYIHPEFGAFSPAPRLRRELRLAVAAGLFGAVIGAVGVIALSTSYRDDNPTSAPRALPAQARPEPRNVPANAPARTDADVASNSAHAIVETHGPTRCEDARECLAEKPHRLARRAVGNGPEIARVPLGRPAVLSPPTTAAAAEGPPAVSEASAALPTARQHAAAVAPLLHQDAGPERPQSAHVPAPKPQKIVRGEKPRPDKKPQERAAHTAAIADSAAGAGSAYARDSSYPRTVFWDWSR
jgi:hypothetical protein